MAGLSRAGRRLAQPGAAEADRPVDGFSLPDQQACGEILGVTFPTAQKRIAKLEAVGILREITGRARNQVFLAADVLALLQAPVAAAEPA